MTEIAQTTPILPNYIKIVRLLLWRVFEGGGDVVEQRHFCLLTTTNIYQNRYPINLISNFSVYIANDLLQLKKAPWIAYLTTHIFRDSVNTWTATLSDIKRYVFDSLTWKSIGYFESSLHAQLWQALFLGSTDPQSEIYLLFKHSGILHALAVSGSNLTMLCAQAQPVLNRFSRSQRFFIWLLIVVTYTFLVGDQPSLVRAAVMSVWMTFGQTIGRKVTFSWALLASVVVILSCIPQYQDSLSFQLSVMAVVGVCMTQTVLSPLSVITEFFGVPTAHSESTPTRTRGAIYNAVLSTLLIQLWVAPLLLLNFGEMSLRGVLMSPVLVFVIPPLMKLVYWAALVLLPSAIPLVAISFYPVFAFLKLSYLGMSQFLITILRLFDRYAPELLIHYQLSLQQLVMWYAVLGIWWWWATYQKTHRQLNQVQLRAVEVCI